MKFLIAQGFGLCAMVALFCIYQQKSRRKLLMDNASRFGMSYSIFFTTAAVVDQMRTDTIV